MGPGMTCRMLARRVILTGLAAVCLHAGAAHAQTATQSFLGRTVLVGAEVSKNAQRAEDAGAGSYMLSDGHYRPLYPWYSSSQQDVHLTMLTSLRENFGLIWGFGTGESGTQYRIDPSLKLGFITTRQYGETRSLAVRLSVVVGGYLTEKPCTANYGAIGGEQKVNCRMASSYLPPAQTLDYLIDQPPGDQVQASVTYKIRF